MGECVGLTTIRFVWQTRLTFAADRVESQHLLHKVDVLDRQLVRLERRERRVNSPRQHPVDLARQSEDILNRQTPSASRIFEIPEHVSPQSPPATSGHKTVITHPAPTSFPVSQTAHLLDLVELGGGAVDLLAVSLFESVEGTPHLVELLGLVAEQLDLLLLDLLRHNVS